MVYDAGSVKIDKETSLKEMVEMLPPPAREPVPLQYHRWELEIRRIGGMVRCQWYSYRRVPFQPGWAKVTFKFKLER